MNQLSRTIHGLNIATIVLSALGILGGVAVAIFMGIASASLNDPAVVNALVDQLQASGSSSSAFDGSSASSYDFSSMTQDEAMAVAGTSIVMMVGLSLGYVLCKVVCLVAGILALRNCYNPAKLGGAFGWGIAAAIICLLTGSMVSMVLFIISVVFIGRLRKAASAGMPGYGYVQQPYQAQPYQQNQQPQPPAGQAPQQPIQPQLQNGQQPASPQQPVEDQASQQSQAQVPPASQQPPSGQSSDGEGPAEQK